MACLCTPLGDKPDLLQQLVLLWAHGSRTQTLQPTIEPDVLVHSQPAATGKNSGHLSRQGLREQPAPPSVTPQASQDSHVKQHIVLRADAQVGPDGCHAGLNIVAQDIGGATSGWEEATQNGPGGAGVSEHLFLQKWKLRPPKEGAPAFMEHLLHAQTKVELYLYFMVGKLSIKENTCYLPIMHPK